MPLNISTKVEKSVASIPTQPVVVPTNTSTLILPSCVSDGIEYVGRYIQNVGANDCYYAIGHDCDSTNYNGILAKPGAVNSDGLGCGSQFDASNLGQAIYVYSRGGTTIAVTLLRRNEYSAVNSGIL